MKPTDSIAKQVSQLSINQSASGQATTSSQPAQTMSVLFVQLSDQKGNQQREWNRKKGKNNRKGGNKNENANSNDDRLKCWGGKQDKRKVKFPCKLCKDDHLTYLCPRIEEASKFLAQGPAMLTNPLPQNMNSRSHDQSGGDQYLSEGTGHGFINMVCAAKVVNRAKDYGS